MRFLPRCTTFAAMFVLFAADLLAPQADATSDTHHVAVSCWYWLNSTQKSQWPQDFKAMKRLGITDVVLVWGLDASAFATRTADSHEAIRAADTSGLGSYLFVWHARHNALPRTSEFAQRDAAGEQLFAFDAFNPRWRRTQWKHYLQTIARAYGKQQGFGGYVFDNSFAIGDIGAIDGAAPSADNDYISYGSVERRLFGKPLPMSPRDPAWAEWTGARQQWWAQWAADTHAAIRAVDPDTRHRIILEDGENTIDPDTESRVGLKLRNVVEHFDMMSAYWAPNYLSPDANDKLALGVTNYLQRMREAIGPDKELALSLRLSDGDTEDAPGHADRPTIAQMQMLIDAALSMGVRHIDLYGYRMGVYHLDGPGWRQYQPGKSSEYPLTGQIEGKFLVDRPELWPELTHYLLQIEHRP